MAKSKGAHREMRGNRNILAYTLAIALMICACSAMSAGASGSDTKTGIEPTRVSPEDAQKAVKAGDALLVCAYEKEAKCRKMNLEGAMFRKEFEAKLPSLSKDQEIIFYCA